VPVAEVVLAADVVPGQESTACRNLAPKHANSFVGRALVVSRPRYSEGGLCLSLDPWPRLDRLGADARNPAFGGHPWHHYLGAGSLLDLAFPFLFLSC